MCDEPKGMVYWLCMGPNCWGRGFSKEDAYRTAKSHAPADIGRKKMKVVYWKANTATTPLAYINDMGGLCYLGKRPERVTE